ncbi:MAG TPA: DUF5655 domain-containing protein [Anaerolineales bacterium]|nr:DUF5655 domain-containing protein [Anaerolineales bacterium]
MSIVERAKATQLSNIEKKTGKSLAELASIVETSGLKKHGEIRSMLMEKFGLTYGDAHNLALFVLKADVQLAAKEKGLSTSDVFDQIYSGPKASLRPIHDKLIRVIQQLGEFEVAPKKGYVSLRRKRQFAMLGPATNTKVELGLNVKYLEDDDRLVFQPAGSMCNYKVRFSSLEEIDDTVISWIRKAFEASV